MISKDIDGEPKPGLLKRARRMIVGAARDPHDPDIYHKMSLVAFFAWVGLGVDGLSSSCYGPAEAFAMLPNHPYLAIFVAMGAVFTIAVISVSYYQIIELFPSGGGGYVVASQLLAPSVGMVSGCALLIDYVLTIALSISSGADAIFSFFPPQWHDVKLWVAVAGVIALTAMNIRGVKESVASLIPIFLIFIVTHLIAIFWAIGANIGQIGAVTSGIAADAHSAAGELGFFGMVFLILRAYSMGAGTYTGIEAVSNGLPILREPKVKTGKRTMAYMASSLMVAVMGLMFAYVLCKVSIEPNKTLNAVLMERVTANWPGTFGKSFVFITLFSEAALLFVAAQTGFLDGPRVLANMALDRWLPSRFAMLSDRLVTQNGVLLMGGAALTLVVLTRGSVQYLLVLYSITVFITFVLSQLGMVRHWWKVRAEDPRWKKGLAVNGIGLLLTSFILSSIAILKFRAGGWVTLLVTGALIALAILIRRHYTKTREMLRRLDSLVAASEVAPKSSGVAPQFDPAGKTAIVLVNGFNGLGLHTLFGIIRLFSGTFKNFIFLQVGTLDAGNFKGVKEIERLKEQTQHDLDKYVDFMAGQGFYAEGVSSLGTDVVEEVTHMVAKTRERYPDAVVFGGQLVFPEETFFTKLLHNYIVFAIQRRLYTRGVAFMIVPIRIS
jgi:amino acid transporter